MLWLSVFGSPAVSQADSSYATGGRAAQARVSFRIVIPPSLYLQVQSVPSDTIQASMLSKDDIETGDQAGGMVRLSVQAYGNAPQKGTMHLSSNSRRSMGNAPGNSYSNHREYLRMSSSMFTTSKNMENATFNLPGPSSGIHTNHFSDKTNPSVGSSVEYPLFILCSP